MNYEEPSWSTPTSRAGYFEVLKGGVLTETIPIPAGTKHLSIGRLPEHGVSLEHESVSRNHAIVQFGPGSSCFVYDLNSSHGSFLNKRRLPSLQYVKVQEKNGLMSFGASSRFLLLHLEPSVVDEEAASDSKDELETEGNNFHGLVKKFFQSHGIGNDDVKISRENGMFVCMLDYSEYLTLESEGSSCVASSGSSKTEALEHFFEDSYNYLIRLGLLDSASERMNEKTNDSSESEDEDDFYVTASLGQEGFKGETLREKDVLQMRDRFREECTKLENEVKRLEGSLEVVTEEEIPDDLDVYVLEIKQSQIRDDILRRRENLQVVKKSLDKYERILAFIGYSDADGPVEAKHEFRQETTKKPKLAEVSPKTEAPKRQVDAERREVEEGSLEEDEEYFEESDVAKIEEIKRNYGY